MFGGVILGAGTSILAGGMVGTAIAPASTAPATEMPWNKERHRPENSNRHDIAAAGFISLLLARWFMAGKGF